MVPSFGVRFFFLNIFDSIPVLWFKCKKGAFVTWASSAGFAYVCDFCEMFDRREKKASSKHFLEILVLKISHLISPRIQIQIKRLLIACILDGLTIGNWRTSCGLYLTYIFVLKLIVHGIMVCRTTFSIPITRNFSSVVCRRPVQCANIVDENHISSLAHSIGNPFECEPHKSAPLTNCRSSYKCSTCLLLQIWQ